MDRRRAPTPRPCARARARVSRQSGPSPRMHRQWRRTMYPTFICPNVRTYMLRGYRKSKKNFLLLLRIYYVCINMYGNCNKTKSFLQKLRRAMDKFFYTRMRRGGRGRISICAFANVRQQSCVSKYVCRCSRHQSGVCARARAHLGTRREMRGARVRTIDCGRASMIRR